MPTTPARRWIAVLLPALLAVAVPAGAAGSWLPPVAGPVTRGFDLGADPFAPGQHRGADLAAPPGAEVRAPCTGRVAFAGRAGANGRVVTLACGPWRVTHLPLATIAVRTGETAGRGDPLGSVGHSPDHGGLHLGVRRATDRFAYTDPLPFLGHADRLSPPPVPAPRNRRPTHPATPPAGPVRAPAPHRVRTPAAPEPRTIAHPTHSMPAVEPSQHPATAGSERTAADAARPGAGPQRPPARGDGPPWAIAAGLLLALAAFARRPGLPRPRRTRRHTRPAAEVP